MAVVAGLLLSGVLAAQASAQTSPAPPAVLLDTTVVAPTGRTIAVASGGDLQGALNSAQLGDVITLDPGAIFTGPFTLPNKAGSGWVTLRSAANSVLPAPGTRVSPSDAVNMPKIVGPANDVAISATNGAHHYRFIGIEFRPASGAFSSGLIVLGGGDTSASTLPHDLIFDRCYIHGDRNTGGKRGIAMNAARVAVIDSYLSDWKGFGMDTQAIASWNGPGPFKIVNNYIEGSGENVMLGGADPTIPNLVPSDLEFRRNDVKKNPAWNQNDPARFAGARWTVKNLFELKNAQRVLIDGNVFENNWADAQSGWGIQLTVRNQDGTAPWSVIQDVAFTNNVLRHSGSAINILGQDNLFPSQTMNRILIRNNVFDDIGGPPYGGNGMLLQVLAGATNVTFDHNTAFQIGTTGMADVAPNPGFVFTNNIAPNNTYGFTGTGTGTGISTLNFWYPGAVFVRNAIVGGNASLYPADNFFPASMADVGFVDRAGGDYHLTAVSSFHNAATDGKDLGANIDAIIAAQAPSSGDGPVPDTTAPTVSITTPAASTTISNTVTITATAADNVGVASVQFQVDAANVGATITAPPYRATWDTKGVVDGTHTVKATARDAAGNATAASISVIVKNTVTPPPDITPPVVSLTAPVTGATVSGMVTIAATATDNVDVASVQFQVNGTNTGNAVTTSPFTTTLNTTPLPNGTYALTAVARDAAGNSTMSAPVTVTVNNPSAGGGTGGATITAQGVVWTNTANVTVSGNSLSKTTGCDGCADAGGSSQQNITSGDGYVEFSAGNTIPVMYVGLNGSPTYNGGALAFSLAIQSGYAIVRELGGYRIDTPAAARDVFRIAIEGGVVKYKKNGAVFYTSGVRPTYPLRANAALYSTGTSVNGAVIGVPGTPSGGTTPPPGGTTPPPGGTTPPPGGTTPPPGGTTPPPGGTTPPTVQNVTWTNTANVTVNANSLVKTSGCDGCADAGGGSTQVISSGDGYFEFTAGNASSIVFVGLKNGGTTYNGKSVSFSIGFQGGYATVWEVGNYRADTRFASGDVFRIAIQSGVVKYSKNGVVFYTSAQPTSYPLRADAALYSAGASVSRAVIMGR